MELGATLLGSNCLADYDHAFLYPAEQRIKLRGQLYARDKINISLTGLGVIDVQGGSTPTFQFGNDGTEVLNALNIIFGECKGITVARSNFSKFCIFGTAL